MEQQLFNIVFSVAGVLGGWVLKTIWDSVRDLQAADTNLADKVSRIEVLVAGNYITRHEFNNNLQRVFIKLDEISAKIEGKADK